MKEEKTRVMTSAEIQKRLSEPFTVEAKLVEKSGEKKGKEIVKKLTNSKKEVSLKRDEKVVLEFYRKKHLYKDYSTSALYIDAFNEEGKQVATLLYDLENLNVVDLRYIEILDENYLGQGLGSIMFEELEDIARTIEAVAITGKVVPIGKNDKTRKFYKDNGCDIVFDPGAGHGGGSEVFYKEVKPLAKHSQNATGGLEL